MAATSRTDAVLTALALIEARLEDRDGDLAYLLDHCGSHRAVAVVLADACAQILAGEFGDQAGEAISQLRQQLLGGGS
jgi:hypothetical protein